MTQALRQLRAKLVVELRCPACGSRNYVFLLNPPAEGSLTRCNECREDFNVKFRVEPAGAKVAYRYLELALDKWFKEFSLIYGKLMTTDVVIDAPKETVKPDSVVGATALDLSSGDVDDVTEVELGRLTHYRQGTGAGVDEIRELLKSDPNNRQLKEWLAFALYTNNLLDDAINTYLELIEDEDADPISHYYLANCYFKHGYTEAATEEWQRVIELAPESHLAKKAMERIKSPRL